MEFNLSQKLNEGTTPNKNNKHGRQKGLDEHQWGSATESTVSKPFNISHLAQLFFPSHTSEPKSMDMREIARRAFDLNSEQREQVLNVIRQMKDLLKPITKPLESGGTQQQTHTEQTSPQQADGEVWQELPEGEWQEIQKHILK